MGGGKGFESGSRWGYRYRDKAVFRELELVLGVRKVFRVGGELVGWV